MAMSKIVMTSVVSLCLFIPSLSSARYIIKLKNGHEITTERYWNDGNRVMFERASGVLGVSKDQVVEITEEQVKSTGIEVKYTGPRDATPKATTSSAPQVATTAPSSAATPPPPKPAEQGQATAAVQPTEKPKEPIDEEYYKEKRQELLDRINAFVEQRSQATQNQDAAGRKAARQGYLKAANDLYALQEELKEKNGGELPEWWKQL